MDVLHAFDIQPTQTDFGDIFAQKTRRAGVFRNNTGPPPERRSTISSMMPCNYQNTRMRNLSGGSTASGSSSGSSTQLDNQYSERQLNFPLEISFLPNNSSTVQTTRGNSFMGHQKLDRSWSDTESERTSSQKSVNSSRYKTELCRPFEENGSCKYGDKCQFAHGYQELRNLSRHPKYKTELCRTFHTVGFCPYGPRCHFIHEDDTKPADASPKLARASSVNSSSGSSSPSLSPSGSNDFSVFTYQAENTQVTRQPANMADHYLSDVTSNMNYNSNYDLQALERHLSSINLNYGSSGDNSSIFNNNQTPRLVGSKERDIFTEISMFSLEDVQLDNAASTPMSSCAAQSMKLDNFSFMDNRTSTHWQSSYGVDY